jgi:hypothetical protein
MRIRPSRGSGRRLDGVPTEGRGPGGPLRPLPPRRPAMEPVCGNCPEGSRCERRCPGNRTRREAKASQRCPKSPNAGAERQPRDREVPESPSTRLSGRLARVSRGVIAPGLPTRHPRTRRTSRAFPRAVGACNNLCEVEPMSQQSKPPAVRKQRELSLRSWFSRFEKLTAAEMRLSRLSQLCPAPDRCRDRTCRRRKGCRKVAAATVSVEAARARLAPACGR